MFLSPSRLDTQLLDCHNAGVSTPMESGVADNDRYEADRKYQREWYQRNKAKKDAKTKAWREANKERSREIARDSMKRAAAAKAVAEGREPGKIGRLKQFTAEQKRAKRKANTEAYNAAHLEEVREKARVREAAKRAGTFVSRALPRLTEEDARIVNVAMAANRRARVRNAGGRYTKDDIIRLMGQQEGKCALCGLPFGDDGYHIDHFVPLSRGGTNDPSNLKLMHPTCNLTKGTHLPTEIGLADLMDTGEDT